MFFSELPYTYRIALEDDEKGNQKCVSVVCYKNHVSFVFGENHISLADYAPGGKRHEYTNKFSELAAMSTPLHRIIVQEMFYNVFFGEDDFSEFLHRYSGTETLEEYAPNYCKLFPKKKNK